MKHIKNFKSWSINELLKHNSVNWQIMLFNTLEEIKENDRMLFHGYHGIDKLQELTTDNLESTLKEDNELNQIFQNVMEHITDLWNIADTYLDEDESEIEKTINEYNEKCEKNGYKNTFLECLKNEYSEFFSPEEINKWIHIMELIDKYNMKK